MCAFNLSSYPKYLPLNNLRESLKHLLFRWTFIDINSDIGFYYFTFDLLFRYARHRQLIFSTSSNTCLFSSLLQRIYQLCSKIHCQSSCNELQIFSTSSEFWYVTIETHFYLKSISLRIVIPYNYYKIFHFSCALS